MRSNEYAQLFCLFNGRHVPIQLTSFVLQQITLLLCAHMRRLFFLVLLTTFYDAIRKKVYTHNKSLQSNLLKLSSKENETSKSRKMASVATRIVLPKRCHNMKGETSGTHDHPKAPLKSFRCCAAHTHCTKLLTTKGLCVIEQTLCNLEIFHKIIASRKATAAKSV